MIRIHRGACPKHLQGRGAEGSYYNHADVVKALWEMQHKKCCYCEITLPDHGHIKAVEHFKPKSLFPALRNTWSNLLLVCSQCNGKKSNFFPIFRTDDEGARRVINCESETDEPPAIVDPSLENPEPEFAYLFDSDPLHPLFGAMTGQTEKGTATLETIGLASDYYHGMRRRHFRRVIMTAYLNLMDALDSGSASEVEQQQKNFAGLLTDRQPFAGFTRAFARQKGLLDEDRLTLRLPVETAGEPKVKVAATRILNNPFTNVGAIHDPAQFIGRDQTLARMLRTLKGGGNLALIDGPKMGKSSVLYQLRRLWEGAVIGPIDFQGLSGKRDFLGELARGLGLARDTDEADLREAFETAEVLVLLDEIEAAPDGIRVMQWFRAMVNRSPGVVAVIAGQQALTGIFGEARGSDWDNLFPPTGLGLMTEAEARQLLNHPWLPPGGLLRAGLIEEVLALGAGHPYLLQQAAYHALEAVYDETLDWRTGFARVKEALR